MKRQEYLSWDDYFMAVALLSGKRSKDPSTQVGACIVNKNNIIDFKSAKESKEKQKKEKKSKKKKIQQPRTESNVIVNYKSFTEEQLPSFQIFSPQIQPLWR